MSRNSAFNFYNKELRPNARSLRNNMTKAEVCLWKYGLRKKQRMGYTFNRQRPVLHYIADFMCKKLKLIIEVDGSSHDSPEAIKYDQRRQRQLEEAGFKVIRFTNKEVLTDMDSVLLAIDKVIMGLENGAKS